MLVLRRKQLVNLGSEIEAGLHVPVPGDPEPSPLDTPVLVVVPTPPGPETAPVVEPVVEEVVPVVVEVEFWLRFRTKKKIATPNRRIRIRIATAPTTKPELVGLEETEETEVAISLIEINKY